MADQQSTPAPATTAQDRFYTLMGEARAGTYRLQQALTLFSPEITGSGILIDVILTVEGEMADFTLASRNPPVPWELLCMVLRELVKRLKEIEKVIAEHLGLEGAQED